MARIDKLYLSINDGKTLIRYIHKNKRKIYKMTNIKYPFNKCYGICGDKIIFNCGHNLDLFLYRYSGIKKVKMQLEEKYHKSFLLCGRIKKDKNTFWGNQKLYTNMDIKNILEFKE